MHKGQERHQHPHAGCGLQRLAIPVYWLLLNKQGNSNTRERIALLKRFIREFGKGRIIKFLADREFVGETWFK